jgi:AraC-like DNA-binding protein
MSVDYQEWPPGAALTGVVLAFWRVVGEGSAVPSPTILPDAYVEIVLNLGEPVALTGPSFTGNQPARAVVGLLDRAIEIRYPSDVCTFGIRLSSACAATFLGVPARVLVNRVQPLRQFSATLDDRLERVLETDPRLESKEARAALETALIEHLDRSQRADQLIVDAVDRLIGADVPITVSSLAAELGTSPRHLHRRFLALVGVSPKRLERLARFARAWRQATWGPPLTWADLALANGYADQSHLVREFRRFGASPPAHLFTDEWYGTTTVARMEGPPGDVRSVQERRKRPRHDGRIAPANRRRPEKEE